MEDTIIHDYINEGMSIPDLEKKWHKDRTTIRKIFKERGIVKNPFLIKKEAVKKFTQNHLRKMSLNNILPSFIKEEYIEKNKSAKEIEEKYKISRYYIYLYLRNMNFKKEKSKIKEAFSNKMKKIWENRTDEEKQRIKEKIRETRRKKTMGKLEKQKIININK